MNNYNVYTTIVLCSLCVLVAILAYLRVLPAELIAAFVSGLIGWLMPSPLNKGHMPDGRQSQDTSKDSN